MLLWHPIMTAAGAQAAEGLGWLQLVLLATIQGLTEFLPISSSAHLILLPQLTGLADQGPMIDLMAHVGSLGAVFIYFHREFARVFMGLADWARGRFATEAARLTLHLAIATPPALAVGAVLHLMDWSDALRTIPIIAFATIGFGVLLWWADASRAHDKETGDMSWRGAAFIGLSQALAFIPGASRSGVTMTAGRFLGLKRDEAARFSMLMSAPILLVGGAVAYMDLQSGANAYGANARDGALVAGLSFLTALLAIWLMMAWLKRASFLPFVLYRFALGAGLLAYMAWRQ